MGRNSLWIKPCWTFIGCEWVERRKKISRWWKKRPFAGWVGLYIIPGQINRVDRKWFCNTEHTGRWRSARDCCFPTTVLSQSSCSAIRLIWHAATRIFLTIRWHFILRTGIMPKAMYSELNARKKESFQSSKRASQKPHLNTYSM